MAQVSVTNSGKTYRMACDDGQEEHLGELAERLDETIDRLRTEFGEIGDQRLTVMAAITMADQQSEAERRIASLEEQIVAMGEEQVAAVESRDAEETVIARSVDTVAERIEALAGRLGEPPMRENGG